MVKTLSLIMALGLFACPNNSALANDLTADKTAQNGQKITMQAPPLCSDNFVIVDKTEGGVPTRFNDKAVKKQEKCPHKSKDIKDCDRPAKLSLPKREKQVNTTVKISVEKWVIEFSPDDYPLTTLDEPPTIIK